MPARIPPERERFSLADRHRQVQAASYAIAISVFTMAMFMPGHHLLTLLIHLFSRIAGLILK